MSPREETVAQAIYGAWYEASHPALRTAGRCEEWREQAIELARIAVEALDAAVDLIPSPPNPRAESEIGEV